jgi:hypothetical protein
MQLELEQQQPYVLFSNSMRSGETRKTYTLLLKKFIEYLGEVDVLLGSDSKLIERRLIRFYVNLIVCCRQSFLRLYVFLVLFQYDLKRAFGNSSFLSNPIF